MDLLATNEEVQELHNELAAHVQHFSQLSRSHDDFTAYFYHLYPPVTPGKFALA